MIPNGGPRTLDSNGIEETSKFGISLKDEAAIINILRDTIYTDKVQAVLREYSANAWDAHREVGKDDVPIKVTLPTAQDPTLYIQDFGPGLSHEMVFEVYTKYGASTKRGSNVGVGMLGIGCKSGFAYSDSFSVTSRHGGKCRTYVALLDESDLGTMNLLSESDCDPNETGITVQIPVRTEDIWEFRQKAGTLFQHFRPHPIINIPLPPIPDEKVLVNGTVVGEEGNWVAVMGCVPYRINIDQLTGPEAEEVKQYIEKLSGSLNFAIGEVQITASREELKYSKKTKEALVARFSALIDEYVLHTMEVLVKGNYTPWEKRLKIRSIKIMGLPVPKEHKELGKEYVELLPDGVASFKTFRIHRGHHGHGATNIEVAPNARFVLKNDEHILAGFELDRNDYVVEPLDPSPTQKTWEDICAELNEIAVKTNIVGIGSINISTLPWVTPLRKTKHGRLIKAPDPKHKAVGFKLEHFNERSKKSSNWAVSNHLCTDKDVFVILERFRIEGTITLNRIREDKHIIESLGGTLPPIYGYKSTGKKPLTKDKCQGVHYDDWRLPFIKSLITPKITKLLSALQWQDIVGSDYRFGKSEYKFVVSKLGEDHDISQLTHHAIKARQIIKKLDIPLRSTLSKLLLILSSETNGAQDALNKILEKYPVLAHEDIGIDSLWMRGYGDTDEVVDSNTKIWYDYVHLVDNYEELNGQAQIRDHQRNDYSNVEWKDLQCPEGDAELSEPGESTEVGEGDGQLGGYSESFDGIDSDSEVVEQRLRHHDGHGDIQGGEPSGGDYEEGIGYGDEGGESGQCSEILATSTEEPIPPVSDSALGISAASGPSAN